MADMLGFREDEAGRGQGHLLFGQISYCYTVVVKDLCQGVYLVKALCYSMLQVLCENIYWTQRLGPCCNSQPRWYSNLWCYYVIHP